MQNCFSCCNIRSFFDLMVLSIVCHRYCKFLSAGKLDFAVNSEFEFWIDDNSSNLYGRTQLHLPAKSMLTKPVKVNFLTKF